MGKPRRRWWGFVKNMIRDYPMLEKSLSDLHQQNMSADNSGMPKTEGGGRTVERVALRLLEPDDQQVYDAVTKAVQIMKLWPGGDERLELIRLMYWVKKPMTAKSASLHLHIADVTAKRWHGDFVRLVGKCYGFKDF